MPIVARFAIDTNQILIGCSDGAIEVIILMNKFYIHN